jgi:hypothetical protein
MPEAVLDHANSPPLEELYGQAPDFAILAEDPTLAEPALVEPAVNPVAARDAEGRMTDDAVEAARRMVEGTKLRDSQPAANPQPERNPDGTLTDDAVAAMRAQLEILMGSKRPPTAETDKQSTLADRIPDMPPTVFEFWADFHGTAEDFAAATEKIAAADVLIVEAGGQDAAKRAAILQKIADMDPSERPQFEKYMRDNEYDATNNGPLMRALFATRKAVGSFDLSGPDLQHNKDMLAATSRVHPDFKLGSQDATIDDFTAKLQDYGRYQRERERRMARNVEPEMRRILDARPELKEKPSLRALEPMGKLHTTLRDDLTGGDLGLHVEGDVPTDADFNHRDQVVRRTMRGEEIPRDLQVRALTEYVVTDKLLQRLNELGRQELANTADFSDYVRDIAAHMSEADMRYVYRSESVDPMTPQRMDRLLVTMDLPSMPHDIEGLRTAAAKMRDMPVRK